MRSVLARRQVEDEHVVRLDVESPHAEVRRTAQHLQRGLALPLDHHLVVREALEVADALFLKHHTTTELVDRAEAGGLLRRSRDDDDHRVVRLHITRAGEAKLTRLSRQHLDELKRLRAGIL